MRKEVVHRGMISCYADKLSMESSLEDPAKKVRDTEGRVPHAVLLLEAKEADQLPTGPSFYELMMVSTHSPTEAEHLAVSQQ